MSHRQVRVLVGTLSAALLLIAVTVYGMTRRQATALELLADAPSFELIDQLERPVSSNEFRGKVIVADFVYTNCPDICPMLSLRMQELQERLAQEQLLGSQVQLLSFTVDPARDTAAVLREYARRFRADPVGWRFLTGPEAEVHRVVEKGFLLGLQKMPPNGTMTHDTDDHADDGYEVMHSTRFALVDREGRIRAYYDGREFDLEHVVRDIRGLLQ
jgi:protein SCO1/2